ncbi:MAG: pyridoxal phosphate-dependent aminotransferase [Pseudomonadota bacterium]
MPNLSARITDMVPGGNDGWGVHYRAQKLRDAGEKVTLLTIGDHDVKTAPEILDAMMASARGGNLGYTSIQGDRRLRAAIAERASRTTATPVGPENVMVCSGGQGAIFATMMAVLDPGNSCIVLDPFYASFDITVRAASGTPIIVPTRADDGFQPDADAIAAAVREDTRAILINTPNNPTGAVYTEARLQGVAEICIDHDLWLISDELYDGQAFDRAHVSPRGLPGMLERTVVIGSMSKGYAMTGARIGWAIGPAALTERMVDLAGATTYGLPGFLQDASIFALTERRELEVEVAERYRRRRNLAIEALDGSNRLRLSPPSGGMYVMIDVRQTGLSGNEFANQLLDAEGIAVMPGESFGAAASGHVRIALTVPNEALIDSMARLRAFGDSVSG